MKHEDTNAKTEGLVSDIALTGMRGLSQAVFRRFKSTYVVPRLNFFDEVDKTPNSAFLGDYESGEAADESKLLAARQRLKSFVTYQLANAQPANGTGVGCGFYDEVDSADGGGISAAMNSYVFDVCFNITSQRNNAHHFAEYCLRSFQSSMFSNGEGDGFVASESGLVSGLDRTALAKFWIENGNQFKALDLTAEDRRVVTGIYIATYREDLPKVFEILDRLATA